MRKILVALSAVAFTAGLAATAVEAKKAPAKTTMGCVKGKEKYNAVAGKCEAAPKKAVKKKK